jgi:hypothetical protein
MIRISTHTDSTRTVVTVEGWLTEGDLEELRRVRGSLAGEVELRLAGLEARSEEGLGLLREWLDSGARLATASPYLLMRLELAKPLATFGPACRP